MLSSLCLSVSVVQLEAGKPLLAGLELFELGDGFLLADLDFLVNQADAGGVVALFGDLDAGGVEVVGGDGEGFVFPGGHGDFLFRADFVDAFEGVAERFGLDSPGVPALSGSLRTSIGWSGVTPPKE